MNVLVNDTLWFRSPDGGEMKMSLGGYPLKEVERLKQSLLDNGWELVSHVNSTKPNRWTVPTWWYPFLMGAAWVVVVQFIVKVLFE